MGRLGVGEFAILFILVLCYFIPSLIASNRRIANKALLIVLNLLAGWTVIGWIVCLIWSLTGRKEFDPTTVIVNTYATTQTGEVNTSQEDFSKTMDNIQKLKDLLDSGAITPEEFERQKGRILG